MSLAHSIPENVIEGLPLLTPSPENWAEEAVKDIDELLADHAHCEMKAAATGFRLVGSYPERGELVDAMLILIREEMRHFERVRERLEARGGKLGKSRPDRYVGRLRKDSHRGASPGQNLVDKLILCAFVEARSCERFRLLALEQQRLPGDLADFYKELALAEARHHETFLNLAQLYSEVPGRYEQRLRDIAEVESKIIASLPALSAIH